MKLIEQLQLLKEAISNYEAALTAVRPQPDNTQLYELWNKARSLVHESNTV